MNLISISIVTIFLSIDTSCTKNSDGTVTFWIDYNGGGRIDMHIGGQTGYIDQYFLSGSPSCGENSGGSVSFILPAGSYTYYRGASIAGTVTLKEKDCKLIKLQ